MAKPQTPLQVNRYFDACVEWLIDSDGGPSECPIESAPFATTNAPRRSIGLCADEAQLNGNPVCFSCKGQATELVQGNPFCRAFIVLACSTCAKSLT
jgi:hypothetical protein